MHKRSFCDFHAPFQIAISVNSVCFSCDRGKSIPEFGHVYHRRSVVRLYRLDVPLGWWVYDGHDSLQLVEGRCTGEEGLALQQLPQYTPHAPHVHTLRIPAAKWDCESTGLHFNIKSHEKMNFYQSFEKCSIHSPDIRKQPETTENK